MIENDNSVYLKQRDEYDHTVNVIEHLNSWKAELEEKVAKNPYDTISHALISEIELSEVRLKLLGGTDIRSKRASLRRLEETPDDYDYRLMCEWGYGDREKWEDAVENGKTIEVKACDYVINM
jgi:hypothetical protein